MMSDKVKAILMAPGVLPEAQRQPGVSEWAAGLGMPVGPLMARLIASEVNLEVLRLFLDPESETLRVPGFTPEGVIPFADSESMDHYAFLADDDAAARLRANIHPLDLGKIAKQSHAAATHRRSFAARH
ncbi:MAG: hypothetical protein ACRELB_21950, partial [Polyangiaceae bacterium]